LRRELIETGHMDQHGKLDKKLTNKNRQFYGDQEVEHMLNLGRGIVNKLTGSYLIAFDAPGSDER